MVVTVWGIADIVVSVAAGRVGLPPATVNQKTPIKQALSDFRNAIRFSKTHVVWAPADTLNWVARAHIVAVYE